MVWIRYDDLYEVSDEGQISNRNTGRILKPVLTAGRYWVCLHGKKLKVSQIVGWALLPRIIRPKDEVDHLNYDRTDDRPCNLQWKSRSANQRNNRSQNIYLKTTHVKGHVYTKYEVCFYKDKKPIYCKQFKTLPEAEAARDAFKASEEYRLSF